MPIYVYSCQCGQQFEKRARLSEADQARRARCPACKKLAERTFAVAKTVNSSQTKPERLPIAPTKYYPW